MSEHIRQVKKSASSSATSVSITFDSAPVAGNLIAVIHHTGHGDSIAPNGFTEALALTNSPSSDQSALYVRKVQAGDPNTITCTSGARDEQMLIVLELNGDWSASFIGDSKGIGTRSANSNSYAIPAAKPEQANVFAIAWMMMRHNSSRNVTAWSDNFLHLDSISSGSAKSLAVATKRISSESNVTTTATMANSNACLGGIALFNRSIKYVGVQETDKGLWSEITSTLDSINPENSPVTNSRHPTDAFYHGTGGHIGVVDKWNGGVIRQNKLVCEYMLVRGGGHQDYYGNEIYKMNLLANPPIWELARAPYDLTIPLNEADGMYAAGEPASVHTYNNTVYDPLNDRILNFGGNGVAGSSALISRNGIEYDIQTDTWSETIADVPSGSGGLWHAHDAGGENIIIGTGVSTYYKYDQKSNTYKTFSQPTEDNTGGCSCYDSKRGHVITLGWHATDIRIYRRSADCEVGRVTTNAPAGMGGPTFGILYDSYRDCYVGWNGGQTLYDLDPDTYTWTTRTLATQTVTPTQPTTNGTYNRFAYIEPRVEYPHGGYVIVNSTTESTYVYKSAAIGYDANVTLKSVADINAGNFQTGDTAISDSATQIELFCQRNKWGDNATVQVEGLISINTGPFKRFAYISDVGGDLTYDNQRKRTVSSYKKTLPAGINRVIRLDYTTNTKINTQFDVNIT